MTAIRLNPVLTLDSHLPLPITEPTITRRVEALRTLVASAERYLPAERLRLARDTVTRVSQRLARSRQHPVVALAGAAGGGKSSLFNALAGRPLSPVGVGHTPTDQAYACVWDVPGQETSQLLDWLQIPPAHRHHREHIDGDEARLRGLVLLDLPDIDSLDGDHVAEARRLRDVADLIVWVMDPQKYADRVVHEEHLSALRYHHEAMVVALNQTDLLTATDRDQLLADLRRLLAADGLAQVGTIAAAAVDPPTGLAPLRQWLADAVHGNAVLVGLSADLDRAVADVAPLVAGPVAVDDPTMVHDLASGFGRVAGAQAAAEVVAAAHRRQGIAETGWAVLRWLGRLRPDPLRRLSVAPPQQTAPPGVSAHDVGQQAAAGLVVREVARRAAEGLPELWREAVVAAARARVDALPAALDSALASIDIDTVQRRGWWRAALVVQWVAAAAAVIGLSLLLLRELLTSAELPALVAGPEPVWLAVGGLAAGVLLALVARPLVYRSADQARQQAAEQLRVVLGAVGQEYVIEPVRAVLQAYEQTREAFARTAR